MSSQQQILHLGPADHGRGVSSDEFSDAELARPWKYEREGGRLIVVAPGGEGPIRINEPCRGYLGAYRLARPEIVDLVASEARVRVDGGTDRMAAIGGYLGTGGTVPNMPDRVFDLAFEVVSPGKISIDRDDGAKRAEHERLGVKESMIVDRFRRTVTVLSAGPGGFVERTLTPDDSYESRSLPGLAIPLREIF